MDATHPTVSTHHSKTMHTCSTWPEDVCLYLGLSSHYVLSIFSTFLTWKKFFPLSIGIDTLQEQLLIEFSTDHFETMHICSTWSEDVHVVLGLSSYHSDLKVNILHCLFVLKFYGPVYPMGSCRAQSVYLTTHLPGRLSPLSG